MELTVGRIPSREGFWLGVEDGAGEWRALAKFRNEDCANRFMEIAKRGIVVREDDGED